MGAGLAEEESDTSAEVGKTTPIERVEKIES